MNTQLFPKREPLPHQIPAIDWCRIRDHVALFMQMRLGKTYVAIDWARRFLKSPHKKALVIAPSSVRLSWQDELAAVGEVGVLLTGSQEERVDTLVANADRRWFLLNYEGTHFRKGGQSFFSPLVEDLQWAVGILDESAEIRDPRTLQTKACMRLGQHADHRAVLCGLPNPEGPEDFYNQMYFVYREFLGCRNYWEFRNMICQQHPGSFDWSPTPATIKMVREAVNANAFCLTRKQAGIGNKRIYERRYVDLPQKIRRGYDAIEREWAIDGHESVNILQVQGWLRRLASGRFSSAPGVEAYYHDAKFMELRKILTTELKQEKFVVSFDFNEELYAAAELLRTAKIKVAVITGETPLDARRQIREDLISGKIRGVLVQIRCLRYGGDWSVADTMIFMNNSGKHNDRAQMEDRIEHPLKKQPLLYLDILVSDSVEIDTLAALKEKGANSKDLTQDIWARLRARVAGRSA